MTRQSLVGQKFGRSEQARLRRFLQRPTIVVVDEAHHAVSATYQRVLDYIQHAEPRTIILGLTATPWPAGAGRTALLKQTFHIPIASIQMRDLIGDQTLARPIAHSIDTETVIKLGDHAVKELLGAAELPEDVAAQLIDATRNQVLVDTWTRNADQWGKTLVFACNIRHAEVLHDLFKDANVSVDLVHSQSDDDLPAVLERFRADNRPRVLVSVGMLLEGVDLPAARTAFLGRPTASQVVMRQMIGRVLRGPKAGGDREAHIVYFRDRWDAFIPFVEPLDVGGIEMGASVADELASDTGTERRLPAIVDTQGTVVDEALVRSIQASAGDLVTTQAMNCLLTSSRLVGYYDLDDSLVPVFENAERAWLLVGDWALGRLKPAPASAKSLFDDTPPPYPRDDDIQRFVQKCRNMEGLPPFTPLDAVCDVTDTARRVVEAGAITADERITLIRGGYEITLARALYPSLQMYLEAVDQEVFRQMASHARSARPESTGPVFTPIATAPRANHVPARAHELTRLFREALAKGRELIAAKEEYEGWLDDDVLPEVAWSRYPLKRVWATWGLRHSRGRRATPRITINSALQISTKHVSDELLRYLIWHELCHHLTPGLRHNHEFRALETLWPDSEHLDFELDTLHERLDLSPAMRR